MSSDKEDELPGKRWIIGIFAGVLIAWIVSPLLLWWFAAPSDRGPFGDQYGALNALFSGLAFAGLIITLFMQRRELQLQRRELEMTRNELAGSKEHLAAQSATLQKQNFENTFFEMIRLHHSIVEEIKLADQFGEIKAGRSGMELIYLDLKGAHRSNHKDDEYRIAVNQAISSRETLLSHYIKNLFCILHYVDEYSIEGKDLYFDIVYSQISTVEFWVIFYCVFFGNTDRWVYLACKLDLLDHIDRQGLLRPDYDIRFYQILCAAPDGSAATSKGPTG